jgi:hypothetical protein
VAPELELELGPEDEEGDGEEGVDEPEALDDDEFEPEPVEVDLPEPVAAPGVPDPPAALDNCANPTLGGLARNTEYTFLRNVSPTIHPGFPFPLCTLLP